MTKPVVVAVIPARGGSKAILRKNLKPLLGKPLIAWTIAHAKAAETVDRVLVSTEDAEIKRVSLELGAEVVDRPAELATDEADTLPVLQHALEQVQADVLVLLQCTSPVRGPGLVDLCVRRFLREQADSLATVLEDRSYEYGQDMPRRQEIRPRLVDNGNVYVMRADMLRRGDRYGKRLATVPVSREESMEIDDPYDFWLAEKILAERDVPRHDRG